MRPNDPSSVHFRLLPRAQPAMARTSSEGKMLGVPRVGVRRKDEEITLRIPAGIEDGEVIRMSAQEKRSRATRWRSLRENPR